MTTGSIKMLILYEKYIYTGKINIPIEKITLLEGDYPQYFSYDEIPGIKFANIIKRIVMEYIEAKSCQSSKLSL